MATEKFPFQTSFAFFTVEKNGNSVDVKYNDNLVIKLPMCNIWNKDEINKRLYQQKETIMNILSHIADGENAQLLAKKNKELSLENKELKLEIQKLKEQLSTPKVNVCAANVESIFNQCVAIMAKTYNEKCFTTSRAKQILNKYNEHKKI